MFQWYAEESGRVVKKEAIDRLYFETQGQPGLIGWFGEILTQGANNITPEENQPITLDWFNQVYEAALSVLPNNNILNIISKAREPGYTDLVLDLFRTSKKIKFKFSKDRHNFLYMNGVIDLEEVRQNNIVTHYVKFAGPFVQNILFQTFADELFSEMGQLFDPFADTKAVFTDTHIDLDTVFAWYQAYLKKNRDWLFKDVPRRVDLRIYEAVFHFNFYMFLHNLISPKGGQVLPEFPTGNGKIDLLIRYRQHTYGVELKSFSDLSDYEKALTQAAGYCRRLKLKVISLIFFIHTIDDANRQKLEVPYTDKKSKVCVKPVFIETGE